MVPQALGQADPPAPYSCKCHACAWGTRLTLRARRSAELAARVVAPASGRAMELYTNQPGVQFYTGALRGLVLP